MGCNCSCTNKDSSTEMIQEANIPTTVLNEKENEKENENERTSIHSHLNLINQINVEEKIKDKEKEKPKLMQKVSLKGTFLDKNISEIIEELNPEANKIKLPENIEKEQPNSIELPPVKLSNGDIYWGGWNLQAQKDGYGINIDNKNKIYKGLWKNNNYGEYGCLINNNGNYYKGQLFNGIAKGKGEMLINNKLKYIGEFDNELPMRRKNNKLRR